MADEVCICRYWDDDLYAWCAFYSSHNVSVSSLSYLGAAPVWFGRTVRFLQALEPMCRKPFKYSQAEFEKCCIEIRRTVTWLNDEVRCANKPGAIASSAATPAKPWTYFSATDVVDCLWASAKHNDASIFEEEVSGLPVPMAVTMLPAASESEQASTSRDKRKVQSSSAVSAGAIPVAWHSESAISAASLIPNGASSSASSSANSVGTQQQADDRTSKRSRTSR